MIKKYLSEFFLKTIKKLNNNKTKRKYSSLNDLCEEEYKYIESKIDDEKRYCVFDILRKGKIMDLERFYKEVKKEDDTFYVIKHKTLKDKIINKCDKLTYELLENEIRR